MSPEEKQRFDLLMGLRKEHKKIRALLNEAYDDLCDHPGAPDMPQYSEEGTRLRWWCSYCSCYLRSEEDYTLRRRIREALAHGHDHRRSETKEAGD